jgi:aminoglycoside 3-N-acetyltransferase
MLTNAERQAPVTVSRLSSDLDALGLPRGAVVLVHCSLSALGWMPGGVQTLINAVTAHLGPSGTLVVPTHSAHLSDPSHWRAPPVPESWWPVIRAEMPAYDPAMTPTRDMGVFAETLRRHPGACRSAHPHGSFAAIGPRARALTATHELGSMFGEASPLGALYAADAWIALLGVGHGNNTSLHLGEFRAEFPGKRWHREGAPLLLNGQRQWCEFDELQYLDDDFPALGTAFAVETGLERSGPLGWGKARLVPMRAIVDFAERWLAANR